VVGVVFIISVLNLALGFILALVLERPLVIYLPRRGRSRTADAADAPSRRASGDASRPRDLLLPRLPPPWRELIEATDDEFSSMIEAAVCVLSHLLSRYHEDMLDMDELARSAIAVNRRAALRDAVQDLIALNHQWMTQLSDVREQMEAGRDQWEGQAVEANELGEVLRDQPRIIKACLQGLEETDMIHDEGVEELVTGGIGGLMRLAHEFRTRLHAMKTAIARGKDSAGESDRDHVEAAEITGHDLPIG
jgi:hypothetical protein